jgi:hypothetical protein
MDHRKPNRLSLPDKSGRTLKFKEIKPWHKILAASIGSLSTYLLWRLVYQAKMDLPYPVELSLFFEALWGTLVGLGPFLGLAILQTIHSLVPRDAEGQDERSAVQPPVKPVRDFWVCSILGAQGGLAGGVVWWLVATSGPLDSSTLAMTGLWTIAYTSAILLPPFAIKRPKRIHALTIPPLALLPVAGFLITKWIHIAPDQADVDMSVGLWLRVSLVVGAVLVAPWTEHGKKAKYHVTGEQISLLMQAMMQKKKWLTKSGMLMHLAEELSYSPATIRKLCSGERRPSAEAARKLLQLGQEAGLNRAWGNDLLASTHHFSDQQIADELDSVF